MVKLKLHFCYKNTIIFRKFTTIKERNFCCKQCCLLEFAFQFNLVQFTPFFNNFWGHLLEVNDTANRTKTFISFFSCKFSFFFLQNLLQFTAARKILSVGLTQERTKVSCRPSGLLIPFPSQYIDTSIHHRRRDI